MLHLSSRPPTAIIPLAQCCFSTYDRWGQCTGTDNARYSEQDRALTRRLLCLPAFQLPAENRTEKEIMEVARHTIQAKQSAELGPVSRLV